MVAYNRVVFEGLVGSGGEIWSCGVNFGPQTGDLVLLPQDLNVWAAAIVAGPIFNLPAGLSNGLSSGGRFTGVKTYYYADHTGPATAVGEALATKVGTGNLNLPLSTCCVATLRTPLSGRRNRGRIYWPALGYDILGAGTFDPDTWSDFAFDMAEFLEGVAQAAQPLALLQPVVLSKVAGTVTDVTSVVADNAPDSQRRRDEGLNVIYSNAPYPPP